jgi:hypothetical protein
LTEQPKDTPDSRDPIWTVPSKLRHVYIAQFSILTIISIIYVCWYQITQVTDDTAAQTVRAIILDTGHVGFAAAVISILTTESWRFTMVVAEWLEGVLERRRQRDIAEATEKARQEGRQEAQSQRDALKVGKKVGKKPSLRAVESLERASH